MTERIGLIGLGIMGKPMGKNLLKAGFPLTVWNRTASRAEELQTLGAQVAASRVPSPKIPTSSSRWSATRPMCKPSCLASRDNYGVRSGSVLVDMNKTAQVTRQIATGLKAKG